LLIELVRPQDIRKSTIALEATLKALAVCVDAEILPYVQQIYRMLLDTAGIPVIHPFNTLMTQLKAILLRSAELDPQLPTLVADICGWIVGRWHDSSKIWRVVYVPLMVDCVVLGLECPQLKVVTQWLEASVVLVKAPGYLAPFFFNADCDAFACRSAVLLKTTWNCICSH